MIKRWHSFWESYRNVDAQSEDDLFLQVGKTIARQPIPREVFHSMVERIIARLEIGGDDHLLDMCCGNGLVSYELARIAGHVTGIDFADHLIKAAVQFKSSANIDYRVGDVTLPIPQLMGEAFGKNGAGSLPQKFLMNDALAYFDPDTLSTILGNVRDACGDGPIRFLLTGVPNAALKWNFYDTPERRMRHEENQRSGDDTNDGLGRWWDAGEVESICVRYGLEVRIENQPDDISNYRMDALIWRR